MNLRATVRPTQEDKPQCILFSNNSNLTEALNWVIIVNQPAAHICTINAECRQSCDGGYVAVRLH